MDQTLPFIKRKIPVQQITWVANALKSRKLGGTVMAGLFLRLDANYDNGAGTTTAENFWRNIISKLEIVINGQDTQIALPFEFLILMNTMEYQVPPRTSVDTSASSTVAAYGNFYLPFELLNAVIPRDTLLDARDISSVVLNVYWGAAGDITNVDTINSASLSIVSKEYSNVPRDAKFARHEYAFDRVPLDVIGDISYDLPVKGHNQYRRLWMLVTDGSTPAVLSNDEVTNFKVQASSFVYYDDTADNNLADQYKHFGRAALTGVYVIDFTDQNQMTTRLNAEKINDLKLIITSGVTDGFITIVSEKAVYLP